MDYILHLVIMICFFTMLSQSLNLSAGYTGLVSLSQAGFYGIGAYTTAILSTHYGLPFWINLPLAMVLCGCIALMISAIALRTVEDYFIVCTLAVQVIIYSLLNNMMQVTNGPLGISNIPPITFAGSIIYSKTSFLTLALSFVCLTWGILKNISRSGLAQILRAISEDEIYTLSIGKNVNKAKIISFTVTAVLAAIPGTLYAHYVSYIDPSSFTLNESTFILSITIIGGLRNYAGSFIASSVLVLLPELLRFSGMPYAFAGNLRQIIYGLVLILIMVTGKNGVIGFFSKKLSATI